MRSTLIGTALFISLGCGARQEELGSPELGSLERGLSIERAINPHGVAESISLTGDIDRGNPFFLTRSATGRSCETCHDGKAGWTIVPTQALKLFLRTDGLAPLFRKHDASNNPTADHSTVQKRANLYGLVTSRGLIQTPQSIITRRNYDLIRVSDPYGYSTTTRFLRFRRPNPISNESLTQTVTWNGSNAAPRALLEAISGLAATFHLQSSITTTEQQLMADFMEGLIHAQAEDNVAGLLDADGARGGAANLAAETFVIGENDPAAPGFDPQVFTLFRAWAGRSGSEQNEARAAIARGEALFNTKSFEIRNVAGLNDALGLPVVSGSCSTCHNTPNIGHHSVFRPMNLGTAALNVPGSAQLPILTVRNKATGETMDLTDLGFGLDTGRWNDLGKFSVPRLRGLASRAPYFHAGSAASLGDVVDFYQFRFGIVFNGTERSDLIAFLAAL